MRKKQLSQEDVAPVASEQRGRKRAQAERDEEHDRAEQEENSRRGGIETHIHENRQGTSTSLLARRAQVILSPAATHSAATRSPTTPITLLSTTYDEDEGEDEDYEFDEDEDEDEEYIDLDMDADGASGASAEGGGTFRSKAWREYVPIKVEGVVFKGECKHCNS